MGDLLHQFGVDGRLLLAQLINFGLLVLLLRWAVYRPLVALLNRRRETVAQSLRDAEAAKVARAEAQEIARATEAEARVKAQAIVSQATADAERQSVAIVAKARTQATAVIAEAKAQLREEQRLALEEAEASLAKLVVAASRRVLGEGLEERVSQKAVERAVADALEELDGKPESHG